MRKGLFVLICLLPVGVCPAEIFIVDDDGAADFNNIQAAIDASYHGDTIYVFPGTYTGPGNRDIDFGGKAVTVQSVFPEDPYIVAITVIDCNGSGAEPHRGFHFHTGETEDSVIDGLTITNGYADYGAAVYCSGNASPTITNCAFQANSSSQGGALYCGGGSPTITNCTFADNSTLGEGGAICCFPAGVTTVTNCTFSGNRSGSFGGAVGGYEQDIYTPVTIRISDCVFIENFAEVAGGAIYGCGGAITNCTFVGNVAERAVGGALYACVGSVRNCSFTGNRANWGGALHYNPHYDYNRAMIISSSVFSGNSASRDGGAIWFGCCKLTLTNCTISGNSAQAAGGGLFNYRSGLTMTNCILWGNTDSNGIGESSQTSGVTPYVTSSCIQDDDPNDGYIPFGGDANDNIDDNPIFVRHPNDGGDGWGDDPETPDVDEGANDDYGDLHLQAGSPCINIGDPCFYGFLRLGDIDGDPRIMGGRIDIGADEFLVPWITVTQPAEGDVWVSGTLHEIEWESYGIDTVDILFSDNNGSDWIEIENNAANTGSYLWHTPAEVDSNQCVVAVVPGIADPNVICTESGIFTVHPDTPGPTVPSKWKSLGGDFDRAGLSENFGPELGCVKWQFETQGPVSASPTIGAEDRVHIACEDGKLYTLDANGVLLWSCDTNSPLISAPTIGPDGTLYVGAEDGRVYAIDINGKLRWTYTTDGFVYSSPAVSADGNSIYACSSDGALYALGRDGSKLWSFRTTGPGVVGGAIFASPAIGPDGTVYTGGFNEPNLYALEPNDGSVKWVCNFEHLIDPRYPQWGTVSGRSFASPVVAPDGTIYQTLLFDPNLHAIEPNTGAIIRSLRLGEWSVTYLGDADGWSEPALGLDGTIYVSFDDPNLWAVDPNGSVKWVTRLGMNEGFSLTVGSDGLIYAAGYDGYLCVVDPSGREMARFQSAGWLVPPVILTDGTIIVSDANNRIWAIADQDCQGQASILHRPEDLDGSRAVDFIDFAMLAADWLSCNHPRLPCNAVSWDGAYFTGDVDRNLYVDFIDLAAVANRWLSEE
ncbi:MAG TPA: PQQ-binding-like beta-propeller repeat protein [Sedimentisphaerales bacterium]|nr:PQQ-binding-like beta-propeller repeat protein [Sedimentisphaerales bacterium]